MKIYKAVLIVILFFFGPMCFGQNRLPIEKLENKLALEKRPILLFIQTDWCGICKIQEKKISKDEELIKALNADVYFSVFNAESDQEFSIKGINFGNPEGEIHEFVQRILNQKIAYPTWIILSPQWEVLFHYNGLLSAKEIKSILLNLSEL